MEPKPQDARAVGLGRLKRRADYQRVSRGRRSVSEAFTLQMSPRTAGEGAATARVGFTVTRKVGAAVVRNRIRRRLKEAIRAAEPLETRPDCDYVLFARREALTRPFGDLVDDLRRAFRALKRNAKDGRGPAVPNPPKGENRRR